LYIVEYRAVEIQMAVERKEEFDKEVKNEKRGELKQLLLPQFGYAPSLRLGGRGRVNKFL